ncbi:MAG TPA: nuclear transport factor 2 family protein [Clostridia bacterium]|nr:nuclear transport factor 2 family protein [Clostridia bacterium]
MSGNKLVVLLLVATLACTTCACTMWGPKKHASWSSATSGEQLERLFWQDVKDKDWKSLERRMAPLLLAINESEVLDRARTLEHVKSFELEDFQIGEVQTRSAGVDLVVTYLITVRGTVNGHPLPTAPVRMMSVWQELGKGWVLVAHSSVPAAGNSLTK